MTREELVTALKAQAMKVVFEKVDGTERVMNCTLQPSMLPDQMDVEEYISEKRVNPDVLAVWDLDKGDWRSFRIDKIKEIELI